MKKKRGASSLESVQVMSIRENEVLIYTLRLNHVLSTVMDDMHSIH